MNDPIDIARNAVLLAVSQLLGAARLAPVGSIEQITILRALSDMATVLDAHGLILPLDD
jgi:hypothetical protein